MSTNNEAYGWDQRIDDPNEGGEYTLLIPGNYPFRVTSVEKAWHNGSERLPQCHKAVINIEIDGGWQGAVQMKTNVFLHRKMDGLNCQFFLSIGHRKHGDPLVMRWNMVPGSTGVVEIAHRKGKPKDGQEPRTFNDAKRFLEPGTPISNHPKPAPAQEQTGFPWEQQPQAAPSGVASPGDDGLAF